MIIDFTMSSQIMDKINQEFHSIWELEITIHRQKIKPGQEYKVEHNINESIKRLKYYSERWMYHACLFMNSIEEEIASQNSLDRKSVV